MNLDKAIEILELNLKVAGKKMPFDVRHAVSLGIEALKKIDYLHITSVLGEDELLPGETPE